VNNLEFIQQKFDEQQQSADESLLVAAGGGYGLPAGGLVSSRFLMAALKSVHYASLVYDAQNRLQTLKLSAFEIFLFVRPSESK
jgi:hypothetical protein